MPYAMETNIVLIGFMGAGKTEVGRLLAKNKGFNFIDLDFLIETHEGMTVSEIFRQKGEIYFREFESKILKDIEKNKHNILNSAARFIDITLKSENLIINPKNKLWAISTGGGMPVFNGNINILKKIGLVIYLEADSKTLYRRIKTEKNRPVLGERGFGEKDVKSKLFEREKFYKKADIIIYTGGLSLSSIAEEIDIFISNLYGI